MHLLKKTRTHHGKRAQALGRIKDESAVEPLIEFLTQEDSDLRLNAAMALGKIGDRRAVVRLIILLGDENWYVRWHAAEALGNIRDERAVDPLIKVVRR